MTSYPGEHSKIPKRLLEALSNQPLTYLVPKDGLSSLISSKVSSCIEVTEDGLFKTDNGNNPTKTIIPTSDELNNFFSSDNMVYANTKIVYKRSRHHHLYPNPRKGNNLHKSDLLKNLSPQARKCLEDTSQDITLGDQFDRDQYAENLHRKRKLENVSNIDLDLMNSEKVKRSILSNSISVNESIVGKRYLDEFTKITQCLRSNLEVSMFDDPEFWVSLGDGHYMLNERTLKHLQIVLMNILKTSNLKDTLNVKDIVLLLEIMTDNISKCLEAKSSDKFSSIVLKELAHMSIYNIFNIFLLQRPEREIYLEKYITFPIKYLSEFIQEINDTYSTSDDIESDLVLLQNSIRLLPAFIRSNRYLDDSFLTKITYFLTDIITNTDISFGSNPPAQYSLETIKDISSDILVAIFQFVPSQRLFLINELLSNVDKFPLKRSRKNLRKIVDGKYATYFTTTILTMLENINSYGSFKNGGEDVPEIVESFITKNKQQKKVLLDFFELINNTVLRLFVQNPTKFRYVIENYVQDLITVFQLPAWPIASEILSSILDKLLSTFDTSSTSALVETACLQVIGQIGSAIFDVKYNTLPNQDNNVVRLYNYPEYIPQFMNSYDNCLRYILANNGKESAYQYLVAQKFEKLIELRELCKENDNASDINTRIQHIIENVTPSNDIKLQNVSYETIKNDFSSILQSGSLISQYESYFHILLVILDNNKVKLRSTAIKALSLLASKDNTILYNPMVKSAITNILEDVTAASVRDAILDLISIGSSYLEYYKQININFDDDSILVRKHILKINERIYSECEDTKIDIFVASRILLKTEDEEDGIIDNAKRILLKNWILSFNPNKQGDEMNLNVIRRSITVMAGVISIDKKNRDVFDWFFNFYVLKKEMHTPTEYRAILSSINVLTDCLVQDIINFQANDTPDGIKDSKFSEYLNLLSLFADATESFINKDHVSGLYPYMLDDERSSFHYHILHVFNKALTNLSNFKNNFLERIELDILKKLVKLNLAEINEAIPIIWYTAVQRNDKRQITKACASCLVHLNPYITAATKSNDGYATDNKIQRLLYLITAFARFCQFDPLTDVLPFVGKKENLSEYVAKCLLVLSRNNIPPALRRTSIKNLINLCGSYPKLFNSSHILKLMDVELNGGDLDLKVTILEGLYNFFLSEENKSLRHIGLTGMLSSNKNNHKHAKTNTKIIDDSVSSALCNRFIDNILQLCMLPNTHDSIIAVKLLKLIVQNGYINPIKCVPFSIALVASNDKIIKQLTKDVLHDLMEKHESLVFNNISKGILIASNYSRKLHKQLYYKHTMFLRQLQDILTNEKKGILRFNKQLDKFISNQINETMTLDSDFNKMSTVLYLSTNVANLEFSSQAEFFDLIKILDFSEEQLRDNILDVLKHEPEEHWNKIVLKMSIIIQYSLKELKVFLLDKFGFKESMLDSIPEQSSRLSQKQMPMQKENYASFAENIDNIISICDDKQICSEYLKEQQYID